MKPERWRQVDQLFQSALERAPSECATFLRDACTGDDSLRREVESLLATDAEAGSFIQEPAYAVDASLIVGDEAPSLIGLSIGHYQILSLLGKGGMGEVYRARDRRLDCEVAIKVLPESFAQNAERLRRFTQEAHAASALSHRPMRAASTKRWRRPDKRLRLTRSPSNTGRARLASTISHDAMTRPSKDTKN